MATKKHLIDHSELTRILFYEKTTGKFFWKEKISKKVVTGREAGGRNINGYIVIGIYGVTYYGHRLAWFYVTGHWPEKIDHEDLDTSNNRWINIRLATQSQNALNRPIGPLNTSGYKGVSWHKGAKKWMSMANVGGKTIYLGLFENVEDAHAAYIAGVAKLEPDFVRGK